MAKTPEEILFGNPVSASHQPVKSELQTWMEEAEATANTSTGYVKKEITTIAHRTAMELAPENTLAGIGVAYAVGFDGVEMDIRFTSDNVPVLIHDATVDRTTSQTGSVSSLSLATIQGAAYECGSHYSDRFAGCRIPTLADALDECMGKFERLHLELKDTMSNAQMDAILGLVVDRGLEDIAIFISFDNANLDYIRSQNAKVGIGYINATPGDLAALVALGGRIYCSFTNATITANPSVIADAQALGIEVYGKTTNEHQDAFANIKRRIRVVQSDNGVLCKPRTFGGNVYKPCLNLAGAILNLNTPGSSITATDGIITITSGATGSFDTLKIPMMTYGGDFVHVEAFVKRISGDSPNIFIDANQWGENPELSHEFAADDVYHVSGCLYMPAGKDGVSNAPLQIGYGSLRSGTCEVFDLKVTLSSRAMNFPGGSFHALIDLTNSGPSVNDNWPPRGIVGAFYPTDADNNLVAIQLEGNNSNAFVGSAEIVGQQTSGLGIVARVTEYTKSGTTDPDYDCLLVRIFDGVTGAPVDLTTDATMNLKVSG